MRSRRTGLGPTHTTSTPTALLHPTDTSTLLTVPTPRSTGSSQGENPSYKVTASIRDVGGRHPRPDVVSIPLVRRALTLASLMLYPVVIHRLPHTHCPPPCTLVIKRRPTIGTIDLSKTICKQVLYCILYCIVYRYLCSASHGVSLTEALSVHF